MAIYIFSVNCSHQPMNDMVIPSVPEGNDFVVPHVIQPECSQAGTREV